MKAIPSRAKNQDGTCPACGAALTQCAGRRKKKVQCPKCREIVVLETKEPAEAPGLNFDVFVARELAEIKARLAQLGPLQNRIAEIERELARLKPALDPNAASEASKPRVRVETPAPPFAPPSGAAKLAPVSASKLDARYGIGAETATHLRPLLESFGGARISFIFAQGNTAARNIAEYLGEVFFKAGWSVLDMRAEHLPPPADGLALAAGPGQISSQASAIHRAFAAARISLAFQIDPAIADQSLILIVGAPPVKPEGPLPPPAGSHESAQPLD